MLSFKKKGDYEKTERWILYYLDLKNPIGEGIIQKSSCKICNLPETNEMDFYMLTKLQKVLRLSKANCVGDMWFICQRKRNLHYRG